MTGGYAIVAGLLLMLFPLATFGLVFDPSVVTKGFVRFGGSLLALFGVYYLGAAWGQRTGADLRGFYWASVWGRLALVVVCAALFIAGEVSMGILLFGVTNLIGAISMKISLDKDRIVANQP